MNDMEGAMNQFSVRKKTINHKSNIWVPWALLESFSRSIFKVLQKIVGSNASSLPFVFIATAIVGFVQATAGLFTTLYFNKKLHISTRELLLSMAFGICSFWSIAGNFWVFLKGGDLGINAFIVSLGIFFGAFIDRLRFRRKLNARQWSGIMLAIFAGYIMLGLPHPSTFFSLPIWIFLSFGVMVSTTLNQWISQEVKTMDPGVKNIWGGFIATILSISLLFLFTNIEKLKFNPLDINPDLILYSSITGLVIFTMWFLDLMSHKKGATIATKKLVVNTGYLVISISAGVIFFHDVASIGKIIGLALYFPAFLLVDKDALNNIWGSSSIKRSRHIIRVTLKNLIYS
jgi:drug/metabolite transporter (DMT)-like permease